MIIELEVYSNKVCEASCKVQRYKVVVKFIEKIIGFEKVVILLL